MSDELFHDAGPENRNRRGASFEDQIVAMADTLNWDVVCRNVDVYMKDDQESRGVDVLLSIWNPRADEPHGWVSEAKCHETQAPSKIQEELQALHKKVSGLGNSEKFKNHTAIKPKVKHLVGGILAHRSESYNPARTQSALLDLELRPKTRGIAPPRYAFFGADTLEALADCFAHRGKPKEFFWPQTEQHNGIWHKCCPPEQIAAGMLAYRSTSAKTVFWLRDGLDHNDIPAIAAICHAWGIDPDYVVCSELDADHWHSVKSAWEQQAVETGQRSHGRLPDSVDCRDLSYDKMSRFNDQWPASEA